VEYTEGQLVGFKEEFARRKRRQLLVTAPFLLVVFAVAVFSAQLRRFADGSSLLVPIAAFLLVIGGLLVFSLRNWRCPACDRYVGRSTAIHRCPKCRVALR
jgi:Na+/alanine symporter